jgi:hypothetical protein
MIYVFNNKEFDGIIPFAWIHCRPNPRGKDEYGDGMAIPTFA